MKTHEKIVASLFAFAIMTLIFTDPMNWGEESGSPTTISPLEWLLYGMISFFLFRTIFTSYREILRSKPKRQYVRHSRSHYSKANGR
jgi:hypothetical protein